MRTGSVVMAIAVAGLASAVQAKDDDRLETSSGLPELLLKSRSPYEAQGEMAQVCQRLRWTPRQDEKTGTLTCRTPNTKYVVQYGGMSMRPSASSGSAGGKPNGYMTGADTLPGIVAAGVTVSVATLVAFTFEPTDDGVVVRAAARREYPKLSGGWVREPIDDQQTFNGLLHVMAMAGNVMFAPGTQFADVGYLGFRSDRFTKVARDGQKGVAIEVGLVETGSPAEAAGLRAGDFVYMLNGRDFGDYDEAARLLSRLKPGDMATLDVERGGDRLTIAAQAVVPPAQLASVMP